MSLSKLIAYIKFRVDQGSVFLTMANFVMLLIVVSEKALAFFHITIPHGELIFTIVFIIIGFIVMFLMGQMLIKIRYIENYTDEQNIRNPTLMEILKEVKELKEEVKGGKKGSVSI